MIVALQTESPKKSSMHLSIVIPIYNEEVNVRALMERLFSVLGALPISFTIICVDDGSSDDSVVLLQNELRERRSIKVVKLSRNFGKEAALSAGLDHASGDAVLFMDADLQHPPELIPELLSALESGVDVVYTVRRSRETDGKLREFFSRSFYRLFGLIGETTIPRDAGDFRILSRRAADALKALPERRRFMKGLYAWVGFSQRAVEFDVDPRANGQSKWSFLSLLSYAWTALISFSSVPLRAWSTIGLAIAILSTTYGVYIVGETIVFGKQVPGYATLATAIFFLGGIQLLSIGILGEYVGRIFEETKNRPIYIVEEIFD